MSEQHTDAPSRIVEVAEVNLAPGEALEDNLTVDTLPEVPAAATPTSTVPSKFEGKTAEDIAKSYTDLEAKFGKQGNELGELRRMTDQILQRQLQTDNAPSNTEPESNLDDDFLLNPGETVQKLVNEAMKPLADKLQNQERSTSVASLEQKHPDMATIVQNEKFQEWILSSPAREANWGLAANGDFEQADDLFSTYKALNPEPSITETAPVADNSAELETATAMSTGASSEGTSTGKPGQVFSRRRLVALQVENPAKYRELASEIEAAYTEGRIVA